MSEAVWAPCDTNVAQGKRKKNSTNQVSISAEITHWENTLFCCWSICCMSAGEQSLGWEGEKKVGRVVKMGTKARLTSCLSCAATTILLSYSYSLLVVYMGSSPLLIAHGSGSPSCTVTSFISIRGLIPSSRCWQKWWADVTLVARPQARRKIQLQTSFL